MPRSLALGIAARLGKLYDPPVRKLQCFHQRFTRDALPDDGAKLIRYAIKIDILRHYGSAGRSALDDAKATTKLSAQTIVAYRTGMKKNYNAFRD